MRFRVKRGGPAAGFTFDRTAKPVQRPEPEKPVSLAQALDNMQIELPQSPSATAPSGMGPLAEPETFPLCQRLPL